MPTIITVQNQKGGVGKTTLATNLAEGIRRRFKKVLLVDSDPQGSARDWYSCREDNPLDLIALDTTSTLKNVHKYVGNYDVVIIDGAAKLTDMMVPAIKNADIVLIPVQPSPYDLWACHDLVDLIRARQEVTEGNPKAFFVVNSAIKNTTLAGDIDKVLQEFEIPSLNTVVTQRQVFRKSPTIGQSVYDYIPKDNDAIHEIESLIDELI